MNRTFSLLIIFFNSCIIVSASETLKLNINQADSIFLNNNFYLLASNMNIEANKAQIIQAKSYPNPIFTADFNAYDPDNNKLFHVGNTGQKGFQFEQLILLGGKRKLEIEMAKTNTKIAELEFQQLLRELKFKLHTNLYAIGQQQFLLARYNSQLALLDTLLNSYQIQVDKGNIPLKDVVRLKGAYLKLNNDRAGVLKQYYTSQSIVQTLLNTPFIIEFQFDEVDIEQYIKTIALTEISNEALNNRPELLIIEQDKQLAQQFLSYQRRQSIPDANLFTSYDQRGGAFNNQLNAGIAIPIPLWNRNKGNIKTSQFKLSEAEYLFQSTQNEITKDIQNNYFLYNHTVTEYQKSKLLYNQDFEITVEGMVDNFQKRNVTIIEFIDFFEAYNEVLTELTRIKTELVLTGEQLNLLIGKDIY